MSEPLSDELLQRYHDGDLSEVEAASVRRVLESDGDAQARMEQIEGGDVTKPVEGVESTGAAPWRPGPGQASNAGDQAQAAH